MNLITLNLITLPHEKKLEANLRSTHDIIYHDRVITCKSMQYIT